MAMTITEKILSRVSGNTRVQPGDRIKVTPDLAMWYNSVNTEHFFAPLERVGATKLADPEKRIFFIDHHTPVKSVEYANVLNKVKKMHQDWGVKVVERMGIGHQVMGEMGAVRPGMYITHFDSAIISMGCLGLLALPTGELLRYMVEGSGHITVPATIKVVLTGELPKGVQGRDVWLRILSECGPSGGKGRILEYMGPGYESMAMDDRMGMMNTTTYSGCVSAIASPDKKALEWVDAHPGEAYEAVYSDVDARYDEEWQFDLGAMEPYVAVPPKPYDARPLSELIGTQIHQAYLGSCASGRVEDLRLAAQVLQGKQKHPDVRVNIVPTSNLIMQEAAREGIVTTLIESGIFLSSPSCDYCFGNASPLGDGDACVSTGTLNITGRMGSTKAKIYTVNAGVVAASAIEGKIADPRNYL
ncbi:3-isopropylmalate dehydratase [SAR202 cluster bacterium AD-802-E10_MRT_200m]|nr:3-isopropylmalate dehydratase [SAR202 cluster bacterium AD-802-E10_MRT_200m]